MQIKQNLTWMIFLKKWMNDSFDSLPLPNKRVMDGQYSYYDTTKDISFAQLQLHNRSVANMAKCTCKTSIYVECSLVWKMLCTIQLSAVDFIDISTGVFGKGTPRRQHLCLWK